MNGSMDLSIGALFASLLVSSVGFGFFLYGKKQTRMPQLVVGLVMTAFPYFITDPLLVCGLGAALVLGLYLSLRAGM
jgi:hypothetical protein